MELVSQLQTNSAIQPRNVLSYIYNLHRCVKCVTLMIQRKDCVFMKFSTNMQMVCVYPPFK